MREKDPVAAGGALQIPCAVSQVIPTTVCPDWFTAQATVTWELQVGVSEKVPPQFGAEVIGGHVQFNG